MPRSELIKWTIAISAIAGVARVAGNDSATMILRALSGRGVDCRGGQHDQNGLLFLVPGNSGPDQKSRLTATAALIAANSARPIRVAVLDGGSIDREMQDKKKYLFAEVWRRSGGKKALLESDVIFSNNSINTRTNMSDAWKVATSNGWENLPTFVVSNNYHVRAGVYACRQGFRAVFVGTQDVLDDDEESQPEGLTEMEVAKLLFALFDPDSVVSTAILNATR